MRRILFELLPEQSDEAFVVLVSSGIPASFVDRGIECDLIAVPTEYAAVARRLIARL